MTCSRVVPAVIAALVVLSGCTDAPLVSSPSASNRQALVTNGGFEADAIGASPASWTIEKYLNNNITPLAGGAPTNNKGLLLVPPVTIADLNLSTNSGGLNTSVVGAATIESQPDPDLGVAGSFRFPKYGTRSVVVNPGNANVTAADGSPTGRNQSVNSMKQTMTLSAGDIDPVDNKVHIRFVAAPVLEDPGHTSFEQPYFFIQVRNVSRGGAVLYSNFNFAGQPGVAWKSLTNPAGNLTKYTDWQVIDVAPGTSAAIGEQIELIVFAAGCSRGGHWGRVYVDAFGTSIPGLYLTGSAPQSSPSNADLQYTLNYRNGAASAVAGTTVVFNTPPNTTFVSTTGTGCTTPAVGAAGTITCPIGAIAAGAGGAFNVVVHIAAGVTGLLTAQNYSIQATGVNSLIGSKIDTTVYTGPATLAVVSGSPQSATVNTAFGADLVVIARDASNQPISGVQVNFALPASGASGTTPLSFGITNASGQASVRPTANTTSGAWVATASAANIATTPTFSLTNTAGAPASVTVVSGTPQSAFTGAAFSAPLVVVVRDSFGNPVPGATVTFTAPGAGSSAVLGAAAVTNAAGQTQVTATGNATAGSYSVTAAVGGATSATFALTNVSTVPASITVVSGTPQSTVVNTAFAQPLVVVVRNAGGVALPGVTVTFTPPASGASATLTGSTTTNASGQVSLAATANTVAGGPYNVTATVGAFTATFALTNTPGAAASVTVVSGTPQSTFTGAAFSAPLVVVVRDSFGNPVPGATVTFTAPGAGASAVLGAAAVTNAAGQTQVTATGNATAGSYSVTAAVGGASSATFALTNVSTVPASISMVSGTPQSTAVTTAFAQPLVVVVRNAGGVALPGVTVTATAPASGASATLTGSTTTNASGQVSLTATANTIAGGPYNVTLTVGALTATFVLTNTAGPAANVALVSGSPQSTAPGTAFTAPLVVLVTDAQGNPVPNATVVFTAPSSGASATITGTTTTDASGRVSLSGTANGTPGSFQVTASVSGVPTPVTFTLTNTAAIAPVIVTPAQNAVLVDATPDVSGTSAPNAPISVFADGGTTPVCSTTADSAGAWTCTVGSALSDGPHTFVATASNGTATASSPPRTVLIDATAPVTPVITAPAEAATTSPSPTISGSAEPGATVRLFIDGATSPACTAVANSAGNYSCVIPGPLASGAHAVTADASDAAGNTSAPTPVRNFTVAPATPPGPPVIAAPSSGQATNDSTPAITGIATPGAEVRVFIDGSTMPACVATALSTGAWTCDVSPALTEGPHAVVATATTPQGTSLPSTTTPFTVDTSAPVAPLVAVPVSNSTTSATPVYAGSSEAGATVKVFVDGSTTPVCTTTSGATGAWTCTSSVALSLGAHAVAASALDAAGNQGPLSPANPFVVAAGQPPSAPVVTGPLANSTTTDSTPAFSGTATPDSTVQVFVDGATTPVCTAVADGTGHFVCAPTTSLSDGSHQVTATSTTPAGTSPNSTSVPFTVDTQAPATPVITSPTPGAQTNRTPTLTGTAEAGSTVTVRIDGQVVCETLATSQGVWSCPVTQPLAPGAHEVTASTIDPAGNRSMTSVATPFTVLDVPTTPVLMQPSPGGTSGPTPTFTGLADPGAVVTVKVDGTTVCTATADAMGHFSCPATTPLSPGAHSVTVEATTPGGTATSSPQTFTVSRGAPSITSPVADSSTTDSTPTFEGTADPGALVTVKVDGAAACTATANDAGHFSCTPTTALTPGPHAVTASTTTGGESTSVPFQVRPSTAVLTPGEGSTTTPLPTFTGTATPGETVVVFVDGAEVCRTTVDTAGEWSCTPSTGLAPGAHQVTAKEDRPDAVESSPTGLTVRSYALSGAGLGAGCSATGSTSGWWLVPVFAFALLLRRRRALAGLALTGSTVLAQTTAVPTFELERARLNGGAAHGLLVESADLLPKYQYRAALTFHYEQDPLVLLEDGKRVGSVVGHRIGLHVSGAFSITDWLDVSLQLPIVLSQGGADLSARGYTPISSGVAAGTPWLGIRAAPWQQRRGDAVDVSIGVALGVPVGSAAALTKDSTVSVIPSIGVGRTLNSFLRIGGSVGVLVRNAQSLTPASAARDEVGSLFTPSLILSTTGDGLRGELSTRLDVPFTRAALGGEVDLGLRYPLFDVFEVYAVGGPGFGTLPGTPTFRVLAGIALAPRAKKQEPALDADHDGIVDAADACPREKGLASNAGCPDADSDGDGILDAVDACPAVRGVAARQGCPVPDGDGDGVLDDVDACPTVAGIAALKGCPEVDTDGDGVADTADACRTVPGPRENGGCPLDTDGDGVVDADDACRTVKGVKENAGCPAAKKQLVTISRDRIVIKEKVNFATARAVILPKSFPLLEQVAQLLKEHPEVERVSIEGHTDSHGSRASNVKLSEARAESVRLWLLRHGIDAQRITAKGFGPDRPIGSNDNEKGREDNRRVEFLIVGAETVNP